MRVTPVFLRGVQAGVTLVELLVAIVLMGIVTLATISLYSATSTSYRTVDAGQEMDDSARFILDVVGRSIQQAGYQEYMPRSTDDRPTAGRVYPDNCDGVVFPPYCPVIGGNNAKITTIGNVDDFGTNNNGGLNASDTLGITFAGSSKLSDITAPDNTVVDCHGNGKATPQMSATGNGLQNSLATMGVNVFFVRNSAAGEPELTCLAIGTTGVRTAQPLVSGVETLQVMYGIDSDGNDVPNRWVSAQDVTNWMTVRAIRIGFVLRSARNRSQTVANADGNLFPLGQAFTGALTETGLIFTPPPDGRLRKAYAATFNLRNRAP